MEDGFPLVSVVTPCYDGEAYLDRYFASLLGQTWPRVEVVFVDDGSRDRTLEVAGSYRAALEARGYSLRLLHQENAGQAAAINLGLPEVTGEFVTWPDADDLMRPDNLERKARYLQGHPEKGFVCCEVDEVAEGDLGRVLRTHRPADTSNPWIFDALIREQGIYCSDIAYMARSSALFGALGGRRIYESRSGQNWQLLFPLAYLNECGFIGEPLAAYVVRRGSHSRSYATPGERMRRTYELEDIILHVLPGIPMSEADREVYEHYARTKYLEQRFSIALETGDAVLIDKAKAALDGEYGPSAGRSAEALIGKAGLVRAACAAKRKLRALVCGNGRG